MKRIIIFILALLPIVGVMAKTDKQVVMLSCDLHCKGCCDKIMKNIAFEKGVKDLVCDLKTKTVTVTYDAAKTDVPTLLKAFDKIGKPAQVKESTVPQTTSQTTPQTTPQSSSTDAVSGTDYDGLRHSIIYGAQLSPVITYQFNRKSTFQIFFSILSLGYSGTTFCYTDQQTGEHYNEYTNDLIIFSGKLRNLIANQFTPGLYGLKFGIQKTF